MKKKTPEEERNKAFQSNSKALIGWRARLNAETKTGMRLYGISQPYKNARLYCDEHAWIIIIIV